MVSFNKISFSKSNDLSISVTALSMIAFVFGYPRPQFIVIEDGNMGEFKREFKRMCKQDNYGIKSKPATNHNH
jgi:hypothetical protein